MLTKMMKFVSIVSLILTVTFWKYAPAYDLAPRFLVALGALVVATQAYRARKYPWTAAFYAIAILFNPFIPVIALDGKLSLSLVVATAALFGVSVLLFKTQPRLSIPSITDRAPGSESL